LESILLKDADTQAGEYRYLIHRLKEFFDSKVFQGQKVLQMSTSKSSSYIDIYCDIC
jgi:hypothetical protein